MLCQADSAIRLYIFIITTATDCSDMSRAKLSRAHTHTSTRQATVHRSTDSIERMSKRD